MGLLDDYFDGYYSEEMVESQVILSLTLKLLHKLRIFPLITWHKMIRVLVSAYFLQVDQLVLEELVREKFPKLGWFLMHDLS